MNIIGSESIFVSTSYLHNHIIHLSTFFIFVNISVQYQDVITSSVSHVP